MSKFEIAYLALVIGAVVAFVAAVGWVDWSSHYRPQRARKPAQSGIDADVDSNETTYRPFLRL